MLLFRPTMMMRYGVRRLGVRFDVAGISRNSRIFSSFTFLSRTQPSKLLVQNHHHQRSSCLMVKPGSLVCSQHLGAVTHFSSQSPLPPPRGGGNRIAQGAGLVGAASLLFGKTKYLLAALKVTKLASLGSMVVSIGAYSVFFGVPYACGIVGLIFVHEA